MSTTINFRAALKIARLNIDAIIVLIKITDVAKFIVDRYGNAGEYITYEVIRSEKIGITEKRDCIFRLMVRANSDTGHNVYFFDITPKYEPIIKSHLLAFQKSIGCPVYIKAPQSKPIYRVRGHGIQIQPQTNQQTLEELESKIAEIEQLKTINTRLKEENMQALQKIQTLTEENKRLENELNELSGFRKTVDEVIAGLQRPINPSS